MINTTRTFCILAFSWLSFQSDMLVDFVCGGFRNLYFASVEF